MPGGIRHDQALWAPSCKTAQRLSGSYTPEVEPLWMSHTRVVGRMWRGIEQERNLQRPSCRR